RRRHGAGTVKAFSAGTRPSGVVHPKVMTCMSECRSDMRGQRSKGLADLPNVEFDVVVAMGGAEMGAELAGVRARRFERWDLPAPKDLPLNEVRRVRDQIEQRVKRLLARLLESELAGAR